jgi:hypothetical protein
MFASLDQTTLTTLSPAYRTCSRMESTSHIISSAQIIMAIPNRNEDTGVRRTSPVSPGLWKSSLLARAARNEGRAKSYTDALTTLETPHKRPK